MDLLTSTSRSSKEAPTLRAAISMEQSSQEGRSPNWSKTGAVSGNFCLISRTASPPRTRSVNCSMAFLLLPANRFDGMRLINAERLLVQKVTGSGEGPGSATHANIPELAVAALAFQVAGVTEFEKHRGVFPDLRQTLLMEIAGQNRQVAAGINFTLIGNERYARAGQTAFGHGLHAIRVARADRAGRRVKANSR